MSTALEKNGLKCLNAALPDDFEAKLVSDEGRIYYLNHANQTSSWVPPRENWDPGTMALPYGWEGAQDRNQKPYYINHVEKYTTREDPRNDPDYVAPPKPREVELSRDTQKGFGFVAGSEKPVIVRFVTDGGPSIDKLMPGDQIIKINGQDVKKAPREFVIDLVRSCKQTISLTVCQPYYDSSRRSALLTAAKKDKLKKNPSRVRFSEDVDVRRVSLPTTDTNDDTAYAPFIPNVLKVFLENGQTKSFKYDNKTTVKDVVNSLQEKLSIKDVVHFNLVLHNMKSLMPGRMTLLQEHENVSEIASRPGARHFRCLFRVMYVPRDSYDLLKQDPIAFEYFYIQCVNDVLQDRFTTELKQETLLRLSALHIQQHAMSNNITGKINIKSIEKEFGLEKFVPQSIREAFKIKDLRKVLAQCLKMNANLTAPGQKQLTALQAKLHYMKIVSELKTFGSRVFMVTLLDKKTEAMILVGPKSGISLVTNVRSYTLSMLADFSEVQCIKISKERHDMRKVEITIKGEEPGTLNLGLLKEDATNFVCMVNGYYRIFVDTEGNVIQKNAGKQSDDPDIPQFESKHIVLASPWSYPEDIVSTVIDEGQEGGDNQRVIDLSRGPPAYEGDKKFLLQLKKDLGLPDIAESQETEGTADKEGFSEGGSPSPLGPVSTNPTSVMAEQPATTKEVNDNNEMERVINSQNLPQKTVIVIESPSNLMNMSVTSSTDSQASTKMDSDSVSSTSTSSLSQNGTNSTNSDAELSPSLPKKVYSSPVMKSRKRHLPDPDEHLEYVNSPRSDDSNVKPSDFVNLTRRASNHEPVEYINIRQTKKFEVGGSSSDTDSGMGGDSERTTFSAENGRGYGQKAEPDRMIGSWLQKRRPTIDLNHRHKNHRNIQKAPLLDLGYMHRAAMGQESPGSGSSLDPDSSFLGPFNPDQLPKEIQDAVYDSRLFSDNELRVDPDIIDLTLLPPFPPTEEELEEESRLGSSHRHSHPPLSKESTLPSGQLDDMEYLKPHLLKSFSVGYTPDFLDNDIDAIIEQFIVQPPPTDLSLEPGNSDRLGTSWNGPEHNPHENGYDNQHLSRTIDLGELELDDQYSSLVIPPPPDTSSTLGNIVIVPPVESVKDKKKKFENSDSDGYLKSFGKKSSVLRLHPKEDAVNENDSSQKSEPKVNSIDEGDNGRVNGESSPNDTSPASVSEKLNALLASLSSYSQEEEEAAGHFRRTSSLRLGRCASLDFLNEPKKVESCDKTSDLVTGSVRVKPKVRPKLSIERPYQSGSGHVPLPLKTGEQVNNAQVENRVSHMNTSSNFTRARSVDVLPTMSEKMDAEASVSESFASLKAKLQSYRDSLLNRSLRRKKKLQDQNQKSESDSEQVSGEGDKVQRKNSLSRSNSFTSLLRRSLGKSSGKEVQSELKVEEAKDDGKSPSKDKKYFNTLSTPRANFRPNTGSSQAQSRAQKTGPIKALSSVFDRAESDPNILSVPVVPKMEKSTKKKAPTAPPTGDQTNVAPAVTKPSNVREAGGTKEFTSSVMSSMTSSGVPLSSAKPVMLSKPLTIPTAPPRRKHLLSHSEQAQSSVTDQTSKDDSTIEMSSPAKTNVKASPFSTVGKMWRPMSMSTSATNDKEETHYQTFNNFDVLREMGTEKLPLTASPRDQVEPVKINGHGHMKAVVSKASSRASKVLTGNGSVSEKSFAVLKEKVSASHSNTVKQILDTVYTSEDFVQATGDVEKLLNELKQTMESLKSSRIDKKPVQFDMCKDELQSQVRQFVTDAKLLVSNATQTREKLAVNMDASMHSLAKIFLHGQATMFMMEAVHQAQHLGSEVMRVANAYKSTLNAAHAAVGKPLADPHMKYLMRQATNLATLLSTLLKSLKTLEQK